MSTINSKITTQNFNIHDFLANSYDAINHTRLAPWLDGFKAGVDARFNDYTHGKIQEWLETLKTLPNLTPNFFELEDRVSIGDKTQLKQEEQKSFEATLKTFHPWRKGPFDLFGTNIDTEWRSDWKWERLQDHISPLKDKIVLDVGCGNGYHCWRMAADSPKLVLGIDPSQLFLMQFSIVKKYLPQLPVHLLPIGLEHLPDEIPKQGFDSIFSMGVLYHRRSPIDHIMHLKKLLKPNGELILETLVIDGEDAKHPDQLLMPKERYAQMNNVWFIPTTHMLKHWMERCNLKEVQIVDINQTSLAEQRSTDWMTFQSLQDFLDPQDTNKTLEGYPAPKRAILIGK